MNDFYGDNEPQLPTELLDRKRSRVEGLNNQGMPLWQRLLIALAVVLGLAGLGYELYQAETAPDDPVVETYDGVHIAGGAALSDAAQASAQFRNGPAYAEAKHRAEADMAQEAQAAASAVQP